MKIPTYDPTDGGNKPGDGPGRVGGVPATEVTADTEDNLPSKRSPAAAAQVAETGLCLTLYAGQGAVHESGEELLPRAPAETAQNYDERLNRSVFHNFFGRTVDGLAGLIFRVDPVLADDVPSQIVEHWENIDLAGTHGDVFCRDIEASALKAGHAAILVDYPAVDGDSLTRRDEEPLRPYWVPIAKEDILSWRTSNEYGHLMLDQVVIRERVPEPVGDYGAAVGVQYRVLRREVDDGPPVVTWQLLKITKAREVVMVDSGVYGNQVEIPIVEVPTSGRLSLFESAPPLVDVAYLNVGHYQMWSDYATGIHKTNCPIFVVTGADNKDEYGQKAELVAGANTALIFDDPAAKAYYVAHSGAQLSSTKDALGELENAMGTLGLAMLASQKRAAETAEAKRLDKSTSDSALSVAARGLQDALERALAYHARYLLLDAGGSITINRDFEGLLMDAPVMTAYVQMVQAGFPASVVLAALQQGGRIPEGADIEAIEMDMMAEAAQRAEAERMRLEVASEEEPKEE